MPIKVQEPTQDQIDEMRKRFLEKYKKEPPAEAFHPNDLARITNNDQWIIEFLGINACDVDKSFVYLWDNCVWRQQYGVNELTESKLKSEYLQKGEVFVRNSDVDGKPLLIFDMKKHTKGLKDMDEVLRIIIYWIERIQREIYLEKITIFFDMSGSSITNMDLDFIKSIIDLFKTQYPSSLNYILIYEMPWILNAAFKIIKTFLPAEALEILKVISKKDISTYIDKENSLKNWGGNDEYEFEFVPEKA